MSEQNLDLGAVWATLRRHLRLLLLVVVVGAVAGVALAVYRPPQWTSTSVVLLPPSSESGVGAAERDSGTQVRVATSDLVLGQAGRRVVPPLDLHEVQEAVEVSATTPDVLRFTAHADGPEQARELADAAAAAELRYISSAAARLRDAARSGRETRLQTLRATLRTVDRDIRATTERRDAEVFGSVAEKALTAALAQLTAQQASLVLQADQVAEAASADVGRDTASLIEAASPATRPGLVLQRVLHGLAGAAALLLLAMLALLVSARRDRRLRFRDEIADALGSTVVASLSSRPARNVAGWRTLLGRYVPGPVDAWSLRQVLRQVLPAGTLTRLHGAGTEGPGGPKGPGCPSADVVVVTLSDDPAALALGPQLATYAASVGLRTRLVPHHGHGSAAGLWAACARVHPEQELRGHLWVNRPLHEGSPEDLRVLMVVLDRARPERPGLPHGCIGVVAVGAGTATAADLARVAVAVDEAGVDVQGVVVLDPDRLDRTTGRRLQPDRLREPQLPVRLTGTLPAERRGRSRLGAAGRSNGHDGGAL
ncbi:hypothetical protein BKA08_000190 [Nocardioides marinisabuli]|uniref:Polysaccharide chain length determinant N-terminal domain-containing protein n=1 Tax=Nocardioides marinisabuli TaxID=419476 RepID=A0A7Y9EXW8_9ACTN|nr:Wzz/FepE/Etk N-terminal domain-containing protein [Nocardioides marinisabuli]NYD55952.1 hypothetical protein [Nocardioides marinisabuli]